MKDNSGFTIVELMIAVALAGIVLTGAYAMFNTIVTSRDVSVRAGDAITVEAKLSSLLASDFRQSVKDSAEIRTRHNNVELRLVTHNSLYFQGALPVEVFYYVDEGYLVREEKMPLMKFEQKMNLIPNADNFTVMFYEAGKYVPNTVVGSNLLKIHLDISGTPIEALAGSYLGNTLFNSAGVGK